MDYEMILSLYSHPLNCQQIHEKGGGDYTLAEDNVQRFTIRSHNFVTYCNISNMI